MKKTNKKQDTRSLIKVIYEDNHLIAINKPAGYLVQGDITGDMPLSDMVKRWIKMRYNKPGNVYCGVIHRLDRPVSGVLIFARTSKALPRMNKLFQERKIKKTYWAITKERPEPIAGKIENFLLKDKTKNVVKAYDAVGRRTAAAKISTTEYEVIGGLEQHSLVKVNPITGRPHQIRVHLAGIGCPIMGDVKYGYKHPADDGRIYLHCREIEFMHPVKNELVRIKADLPREHWWGKFAASFE